MARSRAGYVDVVEAVDEYATFVTNINTKIREAHDLGVGVRDIKYTVTEARAGLYYSALLIFDDQRVPEEEP
jgi:ribosomal protein S6